MSNALEKVILALDHMDDVQILKLLEQTQQKLSFIKIGMQTYYKYGAKFLTQIHEKYNCSIFLDLKLHDIPHTVEGAIESLTGLPLAFLTIHLSGGEKMCSAAVSARDKFIPKTKLLGVTLLTSLDKKDFAEIWGLKDQIAVEQQMKRLVQIAHKSHLDGLICSPNELSLISKLDPEKQLLPICPGIRFSDEISDNLTQDQSRVMSPEQALNLGADYLVMGRSLTKSAHISGRLLELERITF